MNHLLPTLPRCPLLSFTDAWTQDGILEYYWGEHIHLGYYSDDDLKKGFRSWRKKDFKQAKFDFTDKMMDFGGFASGSDFGEGKELKVRGHLKGDWSEVKWQGQSDYAHI